MNKFPVNSLVDKLIATDRNILILDTCCLLDIIRCIQREKPSILKSAIEIIDTFDKGTNKFEIVLPSLIETEWSDNCASVSAETKNHIEKCDKVLKNLTHSFEMIFPTALQSTYFSQYNLEMILSGFSEKLLNLSLCLEGIEKCKSEAINRVVHHIPPAEKGKDSTKDCIIFEETLFLSSLLRNRGFLKRIVFTTSNTKEYYKDDNIIPTIEDELKKISIEIATSLNQGYYLAQK